MALNGANAEALKKFFTTYRCIKEQIKNDSIDYMGLIDKAKMEYIGQ
jgi:hypothetical protein